MGELVLIYLFGKTFMNTYDPPLASAFCQLSDIDLFVILGLRTSFSSVIFLSSVSSLSASMLLLFVASLVRSFNGMSALLSSQRSSAPPGISPSNADVAPSSLIASKQKGFKNYKYVLIYDLIYLLDSYPKIEIEVSREGMIQ